MEFATHFHRLFPGRTPILRRMPIRKQLAVPMNVKNGTPIGSMSRCETCAHSHILQRFRESEEVTFCYYATLMAVPFKVRECSNYQDKARPSWEQMEQLAIEIRPAPTLKPAGFRSDDDSEGKEAAINDTLPR
jgi:hypothetical protein